MMAEHVLVLTADPAAPDLRPADLALAGAALAGAAGSVAAPVWLAADCAAEIPFCGDPGPALAAARMALAGRPLDVNAVARADRRKRLLVADMESTIIRNEMLDELADELGIGATVKEITRRAMNGELDFAAALNERVALLAGHSTALLETVWGRVEFMPGARTLVATMKAHGAYCALVSGGFTVFTGRVRKICDFDEDQANHLAMDGDRLLGSVTPPLVDRAAKKAALDRLSASLGLPPTATLATGDGANDLDMIRAAGLGVAFRAKPLVADAAPARITHGDLTGLLYLQGYPHAAHIAA